MKLKNEQLLARRMRSEADESQYREQEEARQQAREEQRMRMKQTKEDDTRIQSAIEYIFSCYKLTLYQSTARRSETKETREGT